MPSWSNLYFPGFLKLRRQPRPRVAWKTECKIRKRESWPFLSRHSHFISSFQPHRIKRAKTGQTHVCSGIIPSESSSLEKTCPVSILIFEPYLLSLSLMGEEWGEIMMGFLVLIFLI